jgi:hypothetical protein
VERMGTYIIERHIDVHFGLSLEGMGTLGTRGTRGKQEEEVVVWRESSLSTRGTQTLS